MKCSGLFRDGMCLRCGMPKSNHQQPRRTPKEVPPEIVVVVDPWDEMMTLAYGKNDRPVPFRRRA